MHNPRKNFPVCNRIGFGTCKSKLRPSLGFSLVEVLVSIIVLSFGLLGMVGMQASALKSNREARLQSSAVVLARELAEMIRGNRGVGVLPTATNPYIGSFASSTFTSTVGVPRYCLSVGSTCATGIPAANVIATANAEMTEWLERVDAELPGARVDVCYDSTPFDASGLPQWPCTGTGGVIVVKIGWTRGSTDKSQTGTGAFDRARIPGLVFPVTAGSVL